MPLKYTDMKNWSSGWLKQPAPQLHFIVLTMVFVAGMVVIRDDPEHHKSSSFEELMSGCVVHWAPVYSIFVA